MSKFAASTFSHRLLDHPSDCPSICGHLVDRNGIRSRTAELQGRGWNLKAD